MANELKLAQKLVLTSTTEGMNLPKLASDPGSPTQGDMYFNTSSQKVRYYTGSVWQDVGSLLGTSLNENEVVVGNASDISAAVDTSAVGNILASATNGLTIKSNTIDNTHIDVSAGINFSKMESLSPNLALVSNPSGVASTSSVTATELGYLSGVTSGIQSQLGDKANTSLSNVSSTAIPADLIPNTGDFYNLGSTSAGWNSVYALAIKDAFGTDVLNVTNRTLVNSSGQTMITFSLGTIGVNSKKISDLADPTLAQDGATKAYVDNLIQGLNWKATVRVATTANITLSGTQTIDDIALGIDDRVLVKDQTNAAQNGIYLVKSGAWVRTDDANSWFELQQAALMVREGTANQHSRWQCNIGASGTIDVDNVTFIQFAGTGNVSGVGTADYVAYWTGAGTLASEQHLATTRGGLGTNASAFNGVVKATSGSFSSGTIDDADIDGNAAISFSKMASLANSRAVVTSSGGVIEVSSVTATELGYLSGVTSAVQTQLNGKANTTLSNLGTTAINANLLPDSDFSIALGSSTRNFTETWTAQVKTTGGMTINAADGGATAQVRSSTFKRGKDGTNWVEEEYIDATTLTANTTTTPAALTYPTATFGGCEITYYMKQATSNDVRIGTLRISNTGSVTSISDMFSETLDIQITASAAINGANVEISFANAHATRDVTARFDVKRLRT